MTRCVAPMRHLEQRDVVDGTGHPECHETPTIEED